MMGASSVRDKPRQMPKPALGHSKYVISDGTVDCGLYEIQREDMHCRWCDGSDRLLALQAAMLFMTVIEPAIERTSSSGAEATTFLWRAALCQFDCRYGYRLM